MKIAVLGGGSGGHAIAADLTLAGHEVRLAELPQFAENIEAVQALGGIQLQGKTLMAPEPGFARVSVVTTDMREAVRGAELVMVAVPAYGHEAFMRKLLACAEKGQVVVFNSGYFATLVFAKMLADAGRRDDLLIGETAAFIYNARLRGAGRVFVKATKKTMPFSALPASRTSEALRLINQVLPQFVPAQNVIDTSTNEAGIIVHPVATLLNLSRIEQNGPYRSSYYEMTPSIGRMMDAVDADKVAVQRAVGLPGLSMPELLHQFWGTGGSNCYEAIRAVPNYSTQTTPDSIRYRYITEDVPYGLVPIASLGELLGVDTAATRTLAQLASILVGEDYLKTGRTADKMGLSGMSREQVVAYLEG